MSATSLVRGGLQAAEARAAFSTCRSRAAHRWLPDTARDAKKRLQVCPHAVEQRKDFNSFGVSTNSGGQRWAVSQHVRPQIEARTTYEGLEEFDLQLSSDRSSGSAHFSRATFVTGELKRDFQEHYTLGFVIGRGSSATVYSATNSHTQQEVAVKVIQKSAVRDQQMLANEVMLHKATDHPNILRLLDTFDDDDRLYLVTELCEDGDLSRYLEFEEFEEFTMDDSPAMPESDALFLFQQVVASVRYLHRIGIVHRDLKTSNFLFSASAAQSSGQGSVGNLDISSRILKLADFGVSTTCASSKHMLTKRVGTDGFMAPEVMQRQPYNERADIFSMGSILHKLLTGQIPKWKGDRYEFDTVGLSRVSPEVRELVESLLQVRPEDRPSAEMLALHPLLNNAKHQLLDGSTRLDTLLDRMHTYSSFPLLKRAVLVAMVSRAESDTAFAPCIEKFTSIGSHSNMNTKITSEDIYESLAEPFKDIIPPRKACGQFMCHSGFSRFYHTMQDLRGDLEQLIARIDASGCISYSEWLAATVDHSWFLDADRITDAFRLFDKDNDGWISCSDLKSTLPDVFSELLVDDVLEEAQLSCYINEEHFSELIRAC
jgi:serine/threonine protein kinase